MATYTEALANARRKAGVQGRPVSEQEVSGITSGYAEAASASAARAKALRLQEEQLALEKRQTTLQNQQFEQTLAQRREEQASEEKQARAQTVGTTVGIGATVGAYAATGTSVGGPVGGVIGAVVGLGVGVAANSSHMCTEYTKVVNRIDREHKRAYRRMREYARENYPRSYAFYIENGPILIQRIRNTHNQSPQYSEWWEDFHRNILVPMLSAPPDNDAPFLAYITHLVDVLVPTYAPDYEDEVRRLYWMDSVGEEVEDGQGDKATGEAGEVNHG